LLQYPGENQAILIKSLLPQGISIDENIISKHSQADFVRGLVMLAHINTWAVSEVGKRNFQAKWHFGRARPEVRLYIYLFDKYYPFSKTNSKKYFAGGCDTAERRD